jgi:hypothetical protein
MYIEKHINLNIYKNAPSSLKALYIEQLPSSIFMFLIGIGASLAMILLEDANAGKNATTLLGSMTSGLSQFKIFLAIAALLLLLSSITKVSHDFGNEKNYYSKAGYLANISNKGLFSFLVPYAALIIGTGLAIFLCLRLGFNLTQSPKLNSSDVFALFASAFYILIFLFVFYFASLLESFASSRIAMSIVTFIFFILFLIAVIDVAK